MKMQEQYLHFVRIIIRKDQGENLEMVSEELLKVIRMTIPDFDGINIHKRLLNLQEISILKHMPYCTTA